MQPYIDAGWVRDEVMSAPILRGPDDDKPWDRWEILARQMGVPEDLVMLGRDLMALSWAEDWSPMAKLECGWLDGGAGLLHQALNNPAQARLFWSALLKRESKTRYAA